MNEYFPQVVQVVPHENYKVDIFFDDGKIVEYDATPLLKGEAFQRLKDIHFFMEQCTIMNDTLAWDISEEGDVSRCVDIDPFSLYELNAINEQIISYSKD